MHSKTVSRRWEFRANRKCIPQKIRKSKSNKKIKDLITSSWSHNERVSVNGRLKNATYTRLCAQGIKEISQAQIITDTSGELQPTNADKKCLRTAAEAGASARTREGDSDSESECYWRCQLPCVHILTANASHFNRLPLRTRLPLASAATLQTDVLTTRHDTTLLCTLTFDGITKVTLQSKKCCSKTAHKLYCSYFCMIIGLASGNTFLSDTLSAVSRTCTDSSALNHRAMFDIEWNTRKNRTYCWAKVLRKSRHMYNGTQVACYI